MGVLANWMEFAANADLTKKIMRARDQ